MCFSLGPNYHDRRRLPYAHGPYGRPLQEPPLPNRSWAFPLRAMNHTEVTPRRPPLGGPVPVACRGLLPFHLYMSYLQRFASYLVNNISMFLQAQSIDIGMMFFWHCRSQLLAT